MKSLMGNLFYGSVLLLVATCTWAADPFEAYKEHHNWITTNKASAVGKKIQLAKDSGEIITNGSNAAASGFLIHRGYFADQIVEMDYLVAQGSTTRLFLQGKFALPLTNNNNEWQHLQLKLRAARFDAARNKLQSALLMEMRVNGELAVIDGVTQKNILLELTPNAPTGWEDFMGNLVIVAQQGQFAMRNLNIRPADFEAIVPPAKSGDETNEKDLIDYVALGKETFESFGCSVCHAIQADTSVATTGPNLYGLFQPLPRNRDVIEGGEGHKFTIKADRNYLHRSLRSPTDQLAISEAGAKQGEAYPPVMPPFMPQVLSDVQVDAIGAYLATLNPPRLRGPEVKLMTKGEQQAYDPVADGLQALVDNKTRIQRGPLADSSGRSLSGRAIHVGMPNGVNYSFDPRLLGIAKIWQGGFLDMSGEWLNRGGKGLKPGYESREIELGDMQVLMSPLNANGQAVDFSFKEAKFGDFHTGRESLYSKQDHLARLAQENAQFLGYELDSKHPQSAPTFKYRVGQNTLSLQTTIDAKGNTLVSLSGELKTSQSFRINSQILKGAGVSLGELADGLWTLPAGTRKAELKAQIGLSDKVWRPTPSTFDHRKQALKVEPAKADMPAGYNIENYYAPKDNYGRDQLFEALGLAVAPDGTLVVATRTAGVWRLVKDKSGGSQWQQFAEGSFDSLGVVIEDKKGLQVVIGQKAELTRIRDTNGDGTADSYQTLFDAHSYHGNYHAYMHGPVRGGDGAYYININLADGGGDGSTYKANGLYMGTTGGFSGWSFRVQPDGKFEPWARGLRSPAGLGTDPQGQVWYSDNQGEYVGTSKIFRLKKDAFYGHPASLVDLPGMTPDSPEIAWDKVSAKREQAAVLLPHNRLANSPGNLAWDTTKGEFGPYMGQMLIGDQTQSNLLRVTTEMVGGVEQAAAIPFMDGLESGVMRPVFLPDGSLLLGQTGRGWQAKGGHVASLQRITWDGKTIAPAIHTMSATKDGFRLQLTQPLAAGMDERNLQSLLALESWAYRDAADYGSDELDLKKETITKISISEDRKQITMALAQLEQARVHPQQTARVYHLTLGTRGLFSVATQAQLQAYYTLYQFAP
jgi:mono/diheme cytochrome c family protein